MAGIANLSGLSVCRRGREAYVEIVLHLVPKPQEEADEDDDFENDELDLSQPMAELGQRVVRALRHRNLLLG